MRFGLSIMDFPEHWLRPALARESWEANLRRI